MTSDTPDSPAQYFSECVQVGVVVGDIERATANLTRIFGIGPFGITDWPPADRTDMKKYYYGEPAEFTARMAFARIGSIELELIQPVDGTSIWADFLRDHGEGIHHIRFNVDNIEPVIAYLEGHDIKPAQHGSGLRPGTTWVNFGSEEKVGFVIEVMNAIKGTDGRTPQIIDGKLQL